MLHTAVSQSLQDDTSALQAALAQYDAAIGHPPSRQRLVRQLLAVLEFGADAGHGNVRLSFKDGKPAATLEVTSYK